MIAHRIEALLAPVDPASRTWLPCSRIVHGVSSSQRPTSRAQIGPVGDGQGGDDRGEGVAADQLDHDGAGSGDADAAG